MPAFGETTVLGLPLGGKFTERLPACPSDPTAEPTRMCLTEPPFRLKAKGGLLSVKIPDRGTRPPWAVHVLFRLAVGPDSKLEGIEVEAPACRKQEVADSISARFGKPTYADLSSSLQGGAVWEAPDVHATLTYFRESECRVRFQLAADAKRTRDAAAADRARRPVTP